MVTFPSQAPENQSSSWYQQLFSSEGPVGEHDSGAGALWQKQSLVSCAELHPRREGENC